MNEFEQFVRRIASISTPYDHMEAHKRRYAQYYSVPLDEVDDEDVIADYSGDAAWEEAQDFWKLIREARLLLERAS